MPIEVHPNVAKSFAKEYKALPSYQHRQDTQVVINPRRIAVFLDKQAELIERIVEGQMKAKLQTWLAETPSPFYVLHVAGSWFA